MSAVAGAVVLALLTVPIGAMWLRLLGPSGWAQAAAIGLANAVLAVLVVAALGLPVRAVSVVAVLAVEFVVLAWRTAWRPRDAARGLRRLRRLAPSRWRWWAGICAGALSVAALVWTAALALPVRADVDPSTSIAFATAAVPRMLGDLPAGTTKSVPVTVQRAAGDRAAYGVVVRVGGAGHAWTAAATVPGTATGVTVGVRVQVPAARCRYQVEIGLAAGAGAPRYTISLFGGPAGARGECAT